METFPSHWGMESQTGRANINSARMQEANGPQRAPPTGPDRIQLKLQEPSRLFLPLNCWSMKPSHNQTARPIPQSGMIRGLVHRTHCWDQVPQGVSVLWHLQFKVGERQGKRGTLTACFTLSLAKPAGICLGCLSCFMQIGLTLSSCCGCFFPLHILQVSFPPAYSKN